VHHWARICVSSRRARYGAVTGWPGFTAGGGEAAPFFVLVYLKKYNLSKIIIEFV
jgi:hypothetical protein